MADDLLKELLTSPLEEPSRRSRRSSKRAAKESSADGTTITPDGSGDQGSRGDIPRIPLLWGLGSALVAAVIVIAGYSIAAEDPLPTTTTVTTTTIPAAIDDGSPQGLPVGYVEVGDRLGMRVERILSRSDGVFVTVTTVVINSLDPEGTTGWQGGLWTLVLEDGRRITSAVESFDPLARGTVSIWFPQEGYVAGDVVTVELNGIASRTTAPFSAESPSPFVLDVEGETVVGLTPEQFGLDAGVSMSLDELRVGIATAELDWSIRSDTSATAYIAPVVTISTPGGADIDLPLHTQTGFNFHPSVPGPIPTTAGLIGFRLADGLELPTDVELTLGLELNITSLTYDPTVVSLSTIDALITELTG